MIWIQAPYIYTLYICGNKLYNWVAPLHNYIHLQSGHDTDITTYK